MSEVGPDTSIREWLCGLCLHTLLCALIVSGFFINSGASRWLGLVGVLFVAIIVRNAWAMVRRTR